MEPAGSSVGPGLYIFIYTWGVECELFDWMIFLQYLYLIGLDIDWILNLNYLIGHFYNIYI